MRWQRPATVAGQPEPAPTEVQQKLVLDAPAIRGVHGAEGTTAYTDLAARAVVLRNSSGRRLWPRRPQAAAGGFDRELGFRARTGDMVLGASLQAQRISLSAKQTFPFSFNGTNSRGYWLFVSMSLPKVPIWS